MSTFQAGLLRFGETGHHCAWKAITVQIGHRISETGETPYIQACSVPGQVSGFSRVRARSQKFLRLVRWTPRSSKGSPAPTALSAHSKQSRRPAAPTRGGPQAGP